MHSPKRIVFLDQTAPAPYDAVTLEEKPQGGTESTVTRIAEALADRGYEVIVAQHCRREPGQGKAIYLPFDNLDQIHKSPAACISLRTPLLIPKARELFPSADHILWLHDYNMQLLVKHYDLIKGTGLKILGVSRRHKTLIADALISQIGTIEGVTCDFIYNPIADDLQPEPGLLNTKKLLFFSSPHKGLEDAVRIFASLKRLDPEYSLFVANPGYLPSPDLAAAGVATLGSLRHRDVIAEVRSSLAVFHPNFVFEETFGLVHAEANAVGTPVLTTHIGANLEVLQDRRQIIRTREPEEWVDRILSWQKERPVVRGRDEFRLSNILKQWEVILA